MRKVLRLCTLLLALSVSVVMSATDIVLHEGENVISVSDWVVNATYTVKNDGTIVVDAFTLFQVSSQGVTYEHTYAPGSKHGAYHYEVNAKAGDVINVVNTFFMGKGSVWVTENGSGPVPISIEQISPTAGVAFSWTRAGQMTVNFNKQVIYDNIYLVAGTKKYSVDEATAGSNVGCNLTNAIRTAITDGAMKPGDEFVVRFEGLREMLDDANLYNGTGILEIKYFAPGLQGRLVSSTVGGTALKEGVVNGYNLLSYYDTEGEDGIFRFEFDKAVKKVEGARLVMGLLDRSSEGLYYQEYLPVKIDGTVVSIDLRGDLRSYARLFAGVDLEALELKDTEAFTTIALALINVTDEQGNPMNSDAQGSVGSYTFTMNYKEIVDNIVMDGDRDVDVDGAEKRVGDDVQLWIDQQVKSIEGISIYFKVVDEGQGTDEEGTPVYVDGEVKVPASAIETVSTDPYDGTVLRFVIPELKKQIELDGAYIPAADGQKLRVVLQVKTNNGMPHDLVIEYVLRAEATGIEAVPSQAKTQGAMYKLSGQRVSRPTGRGIYVIGGKAVLK